MEWNEESKTWELGEKAQKRVAEIAKVKDFHEFKRQAAKLLDEYAVRIANKEAELKARGREPMSSKSFRNLHIEDGKVSLELARARYQKQEQKRIETQAAAEAAAAEDEDEDEAAAAEDEAAGDDAVETSASPSSISATQAEIEAGAEEQRQRDRFRREQELRRTLSDDARRRERDRELYGGEELELGDLRSPTMMRLFGSELHGGKKSRKRRTKRRHKTGGKKSRRRLRKRATIKGGKRKRRRTRRRR